MIHERLDFAAFADRAASMTEEQIRWALRDIRATLPSADRLDRETGQDRGGLYRDQASVLRRELKNRGLEWQC